MLLAYVLLSILSLVAATPESTTPLLNSSSTVASLGNVTSLNSSLKAYDLPNINVSTALNASSHGLLSDKNDNNQAEETNDGVKITKTGYYDLVTSKLRFKTCQTGCIGQIRVCFEALSTSSSLPREICGSPTGSMCGFYVNMKSDRICFMEDDICDYRVGLDACDAVTMKSDEVFLFNRRGFGCDPAFNGGNIRIHVRSIPSSCSLILEGAKLKKEPQTTALPHDFDYDEAKKSTQEATFPTYAIVIISVIGGFLLIGLIVTTVCCLLKRRNAEPQKNDDLKNAHLASSKRLRKKLKNFEPVEDSIHTAIEPPVPVVPKKSPKKKKAEKAMAAVVPEICVQKAAKKTPQPAAVPSKVSKAEVAPELPPPKVAAPPPSIPVVPAPPVLRADEEDSTQKMEPSKKQPKVFIAKPFEPTPDDTTQEEEAAAVMKKPPPPVSPKVDKTQESRTSKRKHRLPDHKKYPATGPLRRLNTHALSQKEDSMDIFLDNYEG